MNKLIILWVWATFEASNCNRKCSALFHFMKSNKGIFKLIPLQIKAVKPKNTSFYHVFLNQQLRAHTNNWNASEKSHCCRKQLPFPSSSFCCFQLYLFPFLFFISLTRFISVHWIFGRDEVKGMCEETDKPVTSRKMWHFSGRSSNNVTGTQVGASSGNIQINSQKHNKI